MGPIPIVFTESVSTHVGIFDQNRIAIRSQLGHIDSIYIPITMEPATKQTNPPTNHHNENPSENRIEIANFFTETMKQQLQISLLCMPTKTLHTRS